MALTLNILENELKQCAEVTRNVADNPSFQGVRLFLPGKEPSSNMLYVCQSAKEVQAVCKAGCVALSAGLESSAAKNAALALPSMKPLEAFDTLLDIFSRYDAWCATMDCISQSGEPLQKLIDVSEPFLRNNLVVLDPALKLLAYTRNIPCDDPITVELIQHGYHTEANIRKFKLHKRFRPWAQAKGFVVNDSYEICDYVTVVRSFASRTSFSMLMVMMCNCVSLQPYLLDIFEMFAQRVKIYAQRDYPDDKPSGSAVDTFLKDLISGELEDESTVVERSQFVGLPAVAAFKLFYMETGSDAVPSHRLVSDVSFAVAPAKTLLLGNAVVVLSFAQGNDSTVQRTSNSDNGTRTRDISTRLSELLERYDLYCGRSSSFTHLSQLRIAYLQARCALHMGVARAKLGIQRWDVALQDAQRDASSSRMLSFDDYSFSYVAHTLPEDSLKMLTMTRVGNVLEEIANADAEANTDNYEFLRAYLAFERRTSVVAQKLHMHRNNVNYRIGRIEEQFHLNTDDPYLRSQLILAYHLLDEDIGQSAQ